MNRLQPGARIITLAGNGTVRYGRIVEWVPATGMWFVEIDSDSNLPGGEGYRTWFYSKSLVVQP